MLNIEGDRCECGKLLEFKKGVLVCVSCQDEDRAEARIDDEIMKPYNNGVYYE